MVYKSSQQNIELIESDYYNAELQYQNKIDKKENLNSIKKEISFRFIENTMEIVLPEIDQQIPENGTIRMIRLSDKSKDLIFGFKSLKNNTFKIPLKSLFSGMYKLEVEWKSGDKRYRDEKTVQIP